MERNSKAINHNVPGNLCTHWWYLTFQRIERRELGWGGQIWVTDLGKESVGLWMEEA